MQCIKVGNPESSFNPVNLQTLDEIRKSVKQEEEWVFSLFSIYFIG